MKAIGGFVALLLMAMATQATASSDCGAGTLAGHAHARNIEPAPLVRLSARGSDLTARIAPLNGGELAGLELRFGGQPLELLYQGHDDESIASHAPILWPAVGRNLPPGEPMPQDDAHAQFGWLWRGRRYPMPIHGFARQCPWKVLEVERRGTQSFASLSLGDTPATRTYYPFGFLFTVRYVLQGDSLEIRQRIHAAHENQAPMPFSIGNHLTFNIPLVKGTDAHAITIETPAAVQVMTAAGRPTGELRPVSFATPQPLLALPARTAISLAGYASSAPSLTLRDPAGVTIQIVHRPQRVPAGVPILFNLWGDPAAGFFSPEPWVGKQNSLVSGDGLIELAPDDEYQWTITIRVMH